MPFPAELGVDPLGATQSDGWSRASYKCKKAPRATAARSTFLFFVGGRKGSRLDIECRREHVPRSGLSELRWEGGENESTCERVG